MTTHTSSSETETRAKSMPGHIMIVDDEAMVTASLKTMLQLDTPYEITCFNNPKSALEYIAKGNSPQQSSLPDVIISDFLMPEMDGIQFLTQVKQLLPETTLILLTGYADKENAIAAINTVGIYRYIEKPWDNDDIKVGIQNGIERARLLAHLRQSIADLQEAHTSLEASNQALESKVIERTQALQIAKDTLQSIIDGTADGIMTVDQSGSVLSINPTIQEWLTQSESPPIKLPSGLSQWVSLPENHEHSSIEAYFPHTQPLVIREATLAKRPVEISLSFIPETASSVLIFRDISKRKEVERLRDDFMSTLTHDLRTPLLAAIQTLGFFTDGTLGVIDERQKEIITMLSQSSRDMLGLVNVLLEVYRYEAGRKPLILDNIHLDELLESTVSELTALAQQKNQHLDLKTPPSLPSVAADKQEIRRVFINLIGNALNYTPAGSLIEIHAEATKDGVQVCIADNGPGIPPEDLPHLFQRFSQGTSRQRNSGTGLGLYLSRQIMDAHRGKIWVESELNQGTRFYVLLK
ncbi:MAG: response regulator [Cyanobacteria bacterium]|nr:response regulator [Cyanobacteriota bacterium]